MLGCGVEMKSKHSNINSFDLEQLRWNKIIICTDADVDGFQIRTLILTMLYRLVPTLIKEKKVFIAESPLYEITCGKDTYFAYSDSEKNSITAKLKNNDLKEFFYDGFINKIDNSYNDEIYMYRWLNIYK